jgi:hypothetical protein
MKARFIGAAGVVLLAVAAIFLGDFFNRPNEIIGEPDKDSSDVITAHVTAGSGAKTAASAMVPPVAEEKVESPPQPSALPDDLTPEEKTLEAARPPVKTGPLEELKRAYNTESADARSRDIEQQIRTLFGAEYIPVEMLRSISCRKTVCKVSVYWTKDNPLSYMALAIKVGYQQSQIIAIESRSEPDREGRLPVEFYVLRSGHTLADIQ